MSKSRNWREQAEKDPKRPIKEAEEEESASQEDDGDEPSWPVDMPPDRG